MNCCAKKQKHSIHILQAGDAEALVEAAFLISKVRRSGERYLFPAQNKEQL
jgi:hypothetical protein